MVVGLTRLAQKTLLRARFKARPRPVRKKEMTTTGKGGAHTSVMYEAIISVSASTRALARPRRAPRRSVKGAALMKPRALVTKIKETSAYPIE